MWPGPGTGNGCSSSQRHVIEVLSNPVAALSADQEERPFQVDMDIERSMEVLELRPGASLEEVRQAYKDLASVWHPDRFTGNPRLRQKAEERMKEVNRAYEMLVGYLETRQNGPQGIATPPGGPGGGAKSARRDGTEAAFELGTEIFLRACHFFYTSARRLVAERGREKAGKPSS
jgi:curved DNA-binding protein CbpA